MVNFYVSSSAGDDNNNGRSIKTPFKTLARASSISSRGDVTLNLKRGDIWYETLDTAENAYLRNSFTIKPYGVGEMPTIRGCFKLNSNAVVGNANNIYAIDLTKCDGSKSKNRDIGFIYNKDIDKAFRRKKTSKTDLLNNYDFYVEGNILYLYSDTNINSMELYFPHDSIGIKNLSFNSEVYGIKMELHGSLGIATTNTRNAAKNINIHNCIIDLIGGSLNPIGNGIQLFKGCDNVKIHHNVIKRCYDVAVTCQGYDDLWKDVDIYNNYFEENGQTFECWLSKTFESPSNGVVNLKFRNNICKNTGRGWSTTKRRCELLFYNLDLPNVDIEIYNNIFFNPNHLYYWQKDNNKWKSHNNKIFLQNGTQIIYDNTKYTTDNFDDFVLDKNKEINSELIILQDKTNNRLMDIVNYELTNSLYNAFQFDTIDDIDERKTEDGIFTFKSNGTKNPYWVKVCELHLQEDNSCSVYELNIVELEKNTFEQCNIQLSARATTISTTIIPTLDVIARKSSNKLLTPSNFFTKVNLKKSCVELWYQYTDIYTVLSGNFKFIGGIKSPTGQELIITEEYSERNPM